MLSCVFLRFRLGSHYLPNVLGLFHRVPRQQRVCQACQVASLARPIGDEYHLVFECVALRSLRLSYGHLFEQGIHTMRQFIWQRDLLGVMSYIRDAMAILTNVHA